MSTVFEEYLATLVDAEQRTVAEYRRDFHTHVQLAVVSLPNDASVGPLGEVPIAKVADVKVWQAWVTYMRSKTYGKKTIKHYAPRRSPISTER